MKFSRFTALVAFGLAASSSLPAAQTGRPSGLDITDAYQYFLGRLLVLRQEHLDFKGGFKWNEVIHREPGGVASANPSLDVALSEAWVAVDEKSCTIVELPAIRKRYYTVQVVNGWGETVANINERNYPGQPAGRYGLCLRGANVSLPQGAQRVDVPGRKSRVLMRIELGADPAEAVKLQRQIKLYATGKPKIEPAVEITLFENDQLPRIEAFNRVDAILASERDIGSDMDIPQAKARAIAKAARDVEELKRIDEVILKQAIPQFQKALLAQGTRRNGWHRPARVGNYGSDYVSRSLANHASLWANNSREVITFKASTDGKGQPLGGSNVYTLTFPKGQPQSLVRYFWSVTAVDSVKSQVMENTHKVYLFDTHSKLYTGKDGSRTLYFAPKLPDGTPPQNWLPTAAGQNYNLTFRFYGPRDDVASGGYFPPPLVKKN